MTFDSFTDNRSLDRPAFGEDFFLNDGINAFHFIQRDNSWYLYPDIERVLEAVAAHTAGYEHVVAYGSSMGAYAAIRFGGLIGAKVAVAFSPQFSLDRAVVPFETRWRSDAERLDFAIEKRLQLRGFVKAAYVFYDPYNLDRQHIDLYRSVTEVREIRTWNSGHPATGFISEIGLLKSAITMALADELNPRAFELAARARRKTSAHFFMTLSYRSRRNSVRARQWRTALAERAWRLAPQNLNIASMYAMALTTNKKYVEAIRIFDESLPSAHSQPIVWEVLSRFYEQRGDVEAAMAVVQWLLCLHPTASPYVVRSQEVRRARRKWRRRVLSLWRDALQHRFAKFGREVSYSPTPERLDRPSDIPASAMLAPPPTVQSWIRLIETVRLVPTGIVELFMVGDGLVQDWPKAAWARRRIFNYGSRGDLTQHALWRLAVLNDNAVRARHVLVAIGAANLSAGDTPAATLAGIRAISDDVRRVAPGARIWVLALLPFGPDLSCRDDDRRAINALLETVPDTTIINLETDFLRESAKPTSYYFQDNTGPTPAGYDFLMRCLEARFQI